MTKTNVYYVRMTEGAHRLVKIRAAMAGVTIGDYVESAVRLRSCVNLCKSCIRQGHIAIPKSTNRAINGECECDCHNEEG